VGHQPDAVARIDAWGLRAPPTVTDPWLAGWPIDLAIPAGAMTTPHALAASAFATRLTGACDRSCHGPTCLAL
jgi:hypothetical protein